MGGLQQWDASGPVQLIIARLDRPRRCGRGWRATCPCCQRKSASLSIAASDDGRALMHCFGGCATSEILGALGLPLSALYPPSQRRAHTPEERRAAWRAAREAAWSAALGVLGRESNVIALAGAELAAGRRLGEEDLARLVVAVERVQDARAVLT